MKAIRLHARGGPEQIVLDEVAEPLPGPGEVRIRVRAAALTPGELGWDETYRHRDGSPRIPTIPGHDVAGTVDAVGEGVTGLGAGERVYALVDFPLHGSAAEFVVVPAGDVARAPASVDFIHAAALPLSALTAWQALFEHGKLAANERVLIHGGAGGVGAYAVQLARWRGARVLATASPKNRQTVLDLGADEVIDYTAARFEEAARDVDLVFDTVGGETLARSLAVPQPGGRLVSIAAPPHRERARQRGITAVFFIVKPSRTQLEEIARLVDAGRLRPNVQEVFPLAEARRAFERLAAGHLAGKLVLRVD